MRTCRRCGVVGGGWLDFEGQRFFIKWCVCALVRAHAPGLHKRGSPRFHQETRDRAAGGTNAEDLIAFHDYSRMRVPTRAVSRTHLGAGLSYVSTRDLWVVGIVLNLRGGATTRDLECPIARREASFFTNVNSRDESEVSSEKNRKSSFAFTTSPCACLPLRTSLANKENS